MKWRTVCEMESWMWNGKLYVKWKIDVKSKMKCGMENCMWNGILNVKWKTVCEMENFMWNGKFLVATYTARMLVLFSSWCYNPHRGLYFTALWRALASSLAMFHDHIQRRATVGRTPLNEWSVRRRDLYLTTHNTHNTQTSKPWVGFEPTIAAGERP